MRIIIVAGAVITAICAPHVLTNIIFGLGAIIAAFITPILTAPLQ